MKGWASYLKDGLNRSAAQDRVSSGGNLKNLYPFIVRHIPEILFGIIVVFFASLASYPQPLISRFLVDHVILGRKLALLPMVIMLLVVIKVAEEVSSIVQRFYFARFERAVLLDIQEDLIHRVLSLPKSFFDDKETGYLMSRLTNDIQGVRWFFSVIIVQITSTILRFIAGIGLLFYLEWRLALVSLVVIPMLFFSVLFFSKKMKTINLHSMESQAKVSKHMQESISSSTLIKSFSSEKREAVKIVGKLRDFYKISLEQAAVESFANFGMNFIGELPKLVVLVVGVPLIISGHWTLGSLLAFTAYASLAFSQAKTLGYSNIMMQNALASLERISAFYNVIPEEKEDGVAVDRINGEIEFKDVSFSYDGKDLILEKISFKVKPGERIALVGASGAGKTTLLSLMLGFYRPTRGTILFDGRPMEEYSIVSLRKRIGYVSQKILLISGTILENMKYGNENADINEVKKAAQVAGISDFIEVLPNGYNSILGENGVNLSEGQRQRLSIARALIKKPDIIIMDEPSSSLDLKVEKSIFEAIPKAIAGKTLIIAAHREATIKNADRIFEVDGKGVKIISNV